RILRKRKELVRCSDQRPPDPLGRSWRPSQNAISCHYAAIRHQHPIWLGGGLGPTVDGLGEPPLMVFGELRNLEVGESGDVLSDSNNLVSAHHLKSLSSGGGHPER